MVTASYPTGQISFTTKQDRIDVADDDHINQLQVEVVALQQYVGTNPQGDQSSLGSRFNAMINPSGYLISSAGVPQPTSPGMIWYDTDAGVVKLIQTDGTQQSVGGSLSNVIFQSSWESSSDTGVGISYSTGLLSSTGTEGSYRYWNKNSASTTFVEIRDSIQWEKIQGVNTLKAVFNCWSSDAEWVQVSMGIGASTAASATLDQTNPTLQGSVFLDVSGVSNGTVYDIDFKIRREASPNNAYFAELLVYGA